MASSLWLQRQAAVTAHLKSKQLLLFVFARRSVCQYSMAEENPAAQRQTTVTAYFNSKHLLLFVFASLESLSRHTRRHESHHVSTRIPGPLIFRLDISSPLNILMNWGPLLSAGWAAAQHMSSLIQRWILQPCFCCVCHPCLFIYRFSARCMRWYDVLRDRFGLRQYNPAPVAHFVRLWLVIQWSGWGCGCTHSAPSSSKVSHGCQ